VVGDLIPTRRAVNFRNSSWNCCKLSIRSHKGDFVIIHWGFISIHVLVLLIWLRTEAVVEYGRIFGLSKFLKIDDYDEKKLSDFELDYILYLRKFHNNFWIRLITCPICLMCWLATPVIILCGLPSYSADVLITLFLYYLLVKVMR
jgi:hypothetical protein